MEGKLIKLGLSEGYRLDDLNGNYIASTLNGKNKLSLKNCQEIENGYDLIKLIEENSKYSEEDWGDGFLFAMNLMSDKKFSEFLDREKELGISDIKTIERIQWYYKTYFDKSQQTEWDIQIEMEEKWIAGTSTYGHGEYELKPKLDADGCLILRRI